jgi:hypothetical protein
MNVAESVPSPRRFWAMLPSRNAAVIASAMGPAPK